VITHCDWLLIEDWGYHEMHFSDETDYSWSDEEFAAIAARHCRQYPLLFFIHTIINGSLTKILGYM